MANAIVLAFVFTALALSGCATTLTRASSVAVQEKLTMVTIDETDLRDCKIEPMLKKSDFVAMGRDEREDFLTRTLIQQYKNTAVCTAEKRSIKKQLERQQAEIDAHNVKQAALFVTEQPKEEQ